MTLSTSIPLEECEGSKTEINRKKIQRRNTDKNKERGHLSSKMLLTVPEDLLHVHDRLVLLDVMAPLPVVDEELVVDEEEDDGADAGEDGAQHHLQPSFHLKRRKQLQQVLRSGSA
jgi:hypothetical protein